MLEKLLWTWVRSPPPPLLLIFLKQKTYTKTYSEFTKDLLDKPKQIVDSKTNKYGELHSLTEPAILYSDGEPEYYICGKKYTYNDWQRYVDFLKNDNLKTYKYKYLGVIVYSNFYNRFSDIIDLSMRYFIVGLLSFITNTLSVLSLIPIIYVSHLLFYKDKRIIFDNETEALKYINSKEDVVSVKKVIDKYESEIDYLQKRLNEWSL